MTREKEIEQAMKDAVAETIYASGWGMTPQATDLLECAFTKGARWADEHPKKSIKDQLKAVLTANGRYAGSSTTAQLLRELADEWDD